jgi:hypothetical protein
MRKPMTSGRQAADVPETYELKVTTKGEDGTDIEVEIDTALLEKATPLLKEAGLSNEAANKLAPLVLEVQERFVQQQIDAHAATTADWAKQAKEDPEIGGRAWSDTERSVARALDHFVGPKVTKDDKGQEQPNAFRKLLDETGLGNHPEMIRAFAKIGSALGEDENFVRGDKGAQVKKSREEILYPDDVNKKQ